MKKIFSLLITLIFVLTINAKDDSYTERYLKVRDTRYVHISRNDSERLKKEIIDNNKIRNSKFKQLLEQAQEMNTVIDENNTPSDALTALNSCYEVLVSGEQYNIAISILVNFQDDKAKELIIKTQDKEKNVLSFTDIVFKKPIRIEDYIDSDITNLIALGKLKDENDKPLFHFNFSQKISHPLSKFNKPIHLEVMQVDGKYGVKSIPSLNKHRAFLIDPVYENEIILYGSNPGNTYCLVRESINNNYILYDKYGFTLFYADELSPIYVSESPEVAAFIGKRNNEVGYFLYECPEKYELIQEGNFEEGKWKMKPNYKWRISGCSSIENKGNGEFECTKLDGSIETVIIAALKNK